MSIPIGMVCRACITINGEKRYARDYGKKAFCFYPSKEGKEKKKITASTVTFKK